MPLIQQKNFVKDDSVRASFHNERYRKAIHIHQLLELVYVIEGEIRVTIHKKRAIAKAGDMILVYPYQAHGLYTEDGKNAKLWMLLFPNTLVMDIIRNENAYNEYENVIFTPSEPLKKFVESRMFDTNENLTKLDKHGVRHLKALLYPIFDEYISNAPTPFENKKSNSGLISATLTYLHNNFYNDITLSDCSSFIGYSCSHISHCLTNVLGITFVELKNSFRINYAKALLVNDDMSTFRIGLECGFNCERSFDRTFKKSTGLTPKQYREKYTNV